jgi:hypothetical protein
VYTVLSGKRLLCLQWAKKKMNLVGGREITAMIGLTSPRKYVDVRGTKKRRGHTWHKKGGSIIVLPCLACSRTSKHVPKYLHPTGIAKFTKKWGAPQRGSRHQHSHTIQTTQQSKTNSNDHKPQDTHCEPAPAANHKQWHHLVRKTPVTKNGDSHWMRRR